MKVSHPEKKGMGVEHWKRKLFTNQFVTGFLPVTRERGEDEVDSLDSQHGSFQEYNYISPLYPLLQAPELGCSICILD